MAVELVSDGGGDGSRMATPSKDLVSRKSKYKVVSKQKKYGLPGTLDPLQFLSAAIWLRLARVRGPENLGLA